MHKWPASTGKGTQYRQSPGKQKSKPETPLHTHRKAIITFNNKVAKCGETGTLRRCPCEWTGAQSPGWVGWRVLTTPNRTRTPSCSTLGIHPTGPTQVLRQLLARDAHTHIITTAKGGQAPGWREKTGTWTQWNTLSWGEELTGEATRREWPRDALGELTWAVTWVSMSDRETHCEWKKLGIKGHVLSASTPITARKSKPTETPGGWAASRARGVSERRELPNWHKASS